MTNDLPTEIAKNIALNLRKKRKAYKISQSELALKSGVSLGSIKRFERTYEISLISLIKIAKVLNSERDFEELFSQKSYASIDEVING